MKTDKDVDETEKLRNVVLYWMRVKRKQTRRSPDQWGISEYGDVCMAYLDEAWRITRDKEKIRTAWKSVTSVGMPMDPR